MSRVKVQCTVQGRPEAAYIAKLSHGNKNKKLNERTTVIITTYNN